MCCNINKEIIPFEEGEDEKTFYKIVKYNRLSPYYSHLPYSSNSVVHSSRTEVKLGLWEQVDEEIYEGIHVFLCEENACLAKEEITRWKGVGDDYYVIIKVSCRKEDLIGAGYWDGRGVYPTAVFMKVRVLD